MFSIDVGARGIYISPSIIQGGQKTMLRPHQKLANGSHVLLFKWGELYLKGGNRDALTAQLKSNIFKRLGDCVASIALEYNQHFVVIPAKGQVDNCRKICQELPGCSKVVDVLAYKLGSLKEISQRICTQVQGKTIFLYLRNRAKQFYPKSAAFIEKLKSIPIFKLRMDSE